MVIYESHFSTFSHIWHKIVYKYYILIKSPEVNKKVDKMHKDNIYFYIFLPWLLIQPLSFEAVRPIYGLSNED